jgi:hypothetical protein
MARITGHRNQQLPKLHNEIILVGLELPSDPLCGRGSQFERKSLQCLGCFLILGKYRPEVR